MRSPNAITIGWTDFWHNILYTSHEPAQKSCDGRLNTADSRHHRRPQLAYRTAIWMREAEKKLYKLKNLHKMEFQFADLDIHTREMIASSIYGSWSIKSHRMSLLFCTFFHGSMARRRPSLYVPLKSIFGTSREQRVHKTRNGSLSGHRRR